MYMHKMNHIPAIRRALLVANSIMISSLDKGYVMNKHEVKRCVKPRKKIWKGHS